MITRINNCSVKNLNTFGIDALARQIISFTQPDELQEALDETIAANRFMVLGGGSNLLFTSDFEGTLLQPLLQGIEMVDENRDEVLIRVGCGVPWDQLVEYTVGKGWGGLENLSLIPGNTGASPIQNIGAYGVEAGECIEAVEYVELASRKSESLAAAACLFGYRTSIFKTQLKNRLLITYVHFRLSKNPVLKTSYGTLAEEIQNYGDQGIRAVRAAVCATRRKKLPDPAVTGNAGSFFKNPSVKLETANALSAIYPQMPRYPSAEDQVKIPAGWLIEQCKWKGFREGDAGVHPNQALVLVNYGKASGIDILRLAGRIQNSVLEKFQIPLEPEVNIIGEAGY